MSVAELLALAARCEESPGPDRELDRAIGRVAGAAKEQPDGSWMTYHEDGYTHSISAPVYTASLDAAMTLVPEGMAPSLSQSPHQAGEWHASLCELVLGGPPPLGVFQRGRGKASSAALALCAASLRARAAQEQSQ